MPKRELEAVLAHEVAQHPQPRYVSDDDGSGVRGVIAFIADIGFRSLAWGGGRRKAWR